MAASRDHDDGNHRPLLCARCGTQLTPGSGDYYVVRIEALADPTPPSFSEDDLQQDHRAEIERLFETDPRQGFGTRTDGPGVPATVPLPLWAMLP